MRVPDRSRNPRRRIFAVLVTVAALLVLPGIPVVAQPATQPVAAYDHSKDKGKPGTRGPLSADFSRSRMAVKFRDNRDIKLRDGIPVAVDRSENAALRAVLAKYPGTIFSRNQPQTEAEVDAERERLEARTGRGLPDLNSWFDVNVAGDIESLLAELNALPSVEIAFARMETVAPVDPLQYTQVYRTSVNSGSGIDADFAHGSPGGKGEGITVTDVEFGDWESAARAFGSVASGEVHSLMVHRDGTVRAWGLNSNGQLGRGDTTNANVFMKVRNLTDVVAVSAGGYFSMALRSDGTVWTWGSNSNGQLGNGSITDSRIPIQVSGLPPAAAIAAGSDFAVAVLRDGTMQAWGANLYGQLGDGTRIQRLTPVAVAGVTGVSTARGAVAAGTGHTLVVRTTGGLLAWGNNGWGQLGVDPSVTRDSTRALTVPGVSAATQVAAGARTSYARLSSGAAWSWGDNASGQLGNGSTTSRFTPAAVPGLSSVATVTAGGSSAAVTLTNHAVRAWGLNSYGQLGTGGTGTVSVPTAVNLPPGAVQVAAGASHTVAVEYNPAAQTDPSAKNLVWAWGTNYAGQLGTGNTTASTNPVRSVYYENVWNTCHEDLATRPAPAGPPVRLQLTTGSPCEPVGWHGTASVGFVAAEDDNGLGINGLLPKARLQLVNASDQGAAVALARINSQPGDVIWFEVGYARYPWELAADIYDQIVLATAAGVTVVEPAANGGNSLDDPNDALARTVMGRPDSGAIIAGAGEPPAALPWTQYCRPNDPRPAPRTATDFSTYGSRVDVQGWGKCVTSFGMPEVRDLTPTETDPNRMYMSNMNGTSAAAPMVVGAVGAIQGVVKQQSGPPLSPAAVRDLLKTTGAPQPAGDPRHVGPLPDLRTALAT